MSPLHHLELSNEMNSGHLDLDYVSSSDESNLVSASSDESNLESTSSEGSNLESASSDESNFDRLNLESAKPTDNNVDQIDNFQPSNVQINDNETDTIASDDSLDPLTDSNIGKRARFEDSDDEMYPKEKRFKSFFANDNDNLLNSELLMHSFLAMTEGVPTTYKEAMNNPEKDKWIAAMKRNASTKDMRNSIM
jgi:hypothetical protein